MSKEFKILIGIDGSEDADHAFNFYAQHYHQPEQQALLVYVVKPLIISSNAMAIYVGEIREKSMNDERFKVKQLKEIYEEKMRTFGMRGKINIIYYSKKPGKIICELAEQEHCRLIVIGCRRTGRSHLGPTADYVLRKAPCAVSITHLDGLETELSDTVPKMEECRNSRLSKDSTPRLRRISCPAVCGNSLIPEIGASGGSTGSLGAIGTVGDMSALQNPKQRRHSSVVNAFQNLALQASGRRKLIPSTDEEDETKC